MGRPRIVHCKACGGHIDQVGPLSARKLCEGCGDRRIRENAQTMMLSHGFGSPSWREGMARHNKAMARALADDD